MVIAALGTVLAAGYLLWLYQRTAFGEPTAEFSRPTCSTAHAVGAGRQRTTSTTTTSTTSTIFEWIAWTPLLIAHRRVRRLPAAAVQDHRPGRRPTHRGVREVTRCSRRCSPPGTSRHRRSTTTRSRPRSSSPRASALVLLVDLFVAEQQAVDHWRRCPASSCSARCCRSSRWRVIGDDVRDRCSTVATWSTTSASS